MVLWLLVHRHHPHHSLSSFSFWDEDWSRYDRVYGFTDLRGRPARRGRGGRGSRNQVVARPEHHDRALAAATRGAKRGGYVYKQPKQLSYIVHCVISTVCHIRVVFLEPPSRSFWDVWL